MARKFSIPGANVDPGKKQFKTAQDYTFSHTFPASPASGPTLIHTINHGLGYVPAIFAMFREPSFFSGRSSYLPYNVFTDVIYARVDSNDIKIYHERPIGSSVVGGKTFTFRVQVNLDEIG